MRITFLGTAAAAPTVRRGLSSIAVRAWSDRILIDCGEGTQRQMLRYGTGFRVDRILFTHFHADHYLGVIGFLRTLAMGERTEPLFIQGPAPALERTLKKAIHLGWRDYPFPIEMQAVEPGEVIDRGDYRIHVVGVEHRMASVAYVFEEPPRPGRFDLERAQALEVPPGPLYGRLQRGETVELPSGAMVAPDQVMGPARSGRKVAFSGDTRPCSSLIEAARGADLLVHEATFTEDERDRALETMHSTALEAGRVAAEAGARRLVMTHISSRYDSQPSLLVEEAKRSFGGEVAVAEDGMRMEVEYAD
ncbi:MAG: ribonuclease Z [Myxococcota bacterium]